MKGKQNNKDVIKALILFLSREEIWIIMSDGGVASTYHNEVYIVVDLYQSRLSTKINSTSDIWEALGEGKMYCSDSPLSQTVSKRVIDDILSWLVMGFFDKKNEIYYICEDKEEKLVNYINQFVFDKKTPQDCKAFSNTKRIIKNAFADLEKKENIIDFNTIIDDISEALSEADGEWIEKIYNSVCSDKVKYIDDSTWKRIPCS